MTVGYTLRQVDGFPSQNRYSASPDSGFRILGPGEGRNPGAGDRGALKPLAVVGILRGVKPYEQRAAA